MKENIVDCRGLACPIPVLKTKEALEKGIGNFTIIVDNKASRENVKRFVEKMGYSAHVEEKDGEFYIAVKVGQTKAETEKKEAGEKGTYSVLITGTYVGEDEELGKILIKGFVKTFVNADPLPAKVILINTAVKFACRGADPEILEALEELKGKGVEVICCGTCLDYFNLLDDLKIGIASNAFDVVQSLANSGNVIRL